MIDPKTGIILDMVNHPPHYKGPYLAVAECESDGTIKRNTPWLKTTMQLARFIHIQIECIDIIRHIKDMRLANAMKHIWRVAFGGKGNDREDIEKAQWYLEDWLQNKIDGQEQASAPAIPTLVQPDQFLTDGFIGGEADRHGVQKTYLYF